MLCFDICIPSLFSPGVQISKHDMHGTFDPINNLTPLGPVLRLYGQLAL